MASPALAFWYEFASPYSYLAAWRIEALATAAGCAVTWKPFLLGPIFARQGWSDSPFNLYPAKGNYLWRDMARESARLGILWRQPSTLPRNSLLAARMALALEADAPDAPERLIAFSKAVFAANFTQDQDIADPAVLESLLETLGLPVATVQEQATLPAIKDRLRHNTEAAMAAGLFGAPAFTVDRPSGQELFWGNDRLEQALACACASTGEHAPERSAGD